MVYDLFVNLEQFFIVPGITRKFVWICKVYYFANSTDIKEIKIL